MIYSRVGEVRPDLFRNSTHVPYHQRLHQSAAILGEMALYKTTDLPAQVLNRTPRPPGFSRQQLHPLVVLQESGHVDLLPGQVGGVIEAAGIPVIARDKRPQPETDAVSVAPFPPYISDADQEVSTDLLCAGRAPDALGAHNPTAALRQFFRLLVKHPLYIELIALTHEGANMTRRKHRMEHVIVSDVTQREGQPGEKG